MTKAKTKRQVKGYTVEVPCYCKTGYIKTPEGIKVPCAYCKGTKIRIERTVHPSHNMTNKRCEMIAPCGTPRFYTVRNCKVCLREEWQHAAGHFLHGLDFQCSGNKGK